MPSIATCGNGTVPVESNMGLIRTCRLRVVVSFRTDFPPTMKAELVPENGDPPIPILRDVTVVGRHADCDVVINEASLSKRHCVFVKTDGLLVIRDLATTNGTKVKGQKVRWAALLPEDKISLGGYKLRVYLGSDEMPSPSEQRRGRGGAKGPAGVDGLSRSSSRGEASPSPSPGQVRPVTPAFAEPSYHDATLPPFEVMDAATGSGESEEFLPNFELIEDDDDDIIDL
jgi:predicted component of type VI protein secretion system